MGRPTIIELKQVNARLQNRSPEELEELIKAMEESGYMWDPMKKIFNNPHLGRGIRIESLDMFNPEEFRETHLEIEREITKNPMAEQAKKIWALWIVKFIGLIILWGMFSWIFGWRVWIIGLITLISGVLIFYYYCSKRWSKK